MLRTMGVLFVVQVWAASAGDAGSISARTVNVICVVTACIATFLVGLRLGQERSEWEP